MEKTAQQLIAELTADYEMTEDELCKAMQQGNLVEGLTKQERQLLADYWELNSSQLS